MTGALALERGAICARAMMLNSENAAMIDQVAHATKPRHRRPGALAAPSSGMRILPAFIDLEVYCPDMNLLYRKPGAPWSFDTTRLCLALIAASSLALAASESGLAGPAKCGKCHAAQYEKQSRSRHARALRPIRESIWAAPAGGVTDRAFAISYQPQAESVDVLVSSPSGGISASLTWAFGAGAQGLTPVGIENGRYFEHRFSYYSRPNRLARTFGHPARPETAASELGVPQEPKTIFECFNCHSTGAIFGASGPDLSEMIPGVTCERCHGPGQAHVSAAETGASADVIRRSIVNPKRFPGESAGRDVRAMPPVASAECVPRT